MSKGKGGGARRGPFTGKKTIFATRLTDETMEQLVEVAERANQSISQKAEALLADAIRRENLITRLFTEDFRHFEAVMKDLVVSEQPTEKEVMLWRDRAVATCEKLCAEWTANAVEHAEVLMAAMTERVQSSVDAVPKSADGAAHRPARRRKLDLS